MKLACALAIMAVVATVTPARADEQTPKERAQLLVNEGYELAQRGDHLGALGKFEAAFELYQSPNLHIYIGTALWNLGRYAEARSSYLAYLEHPDAVEEKVVQVEVFLDQLAGDLGVLAIRVAPPDAVVFVDGVDVTATEVYVDPGRHTVSVSAEGYVFETHHFDVAAGVTVIAEIELGKSKPPTIVAPPVAEPETPREPTGPPRGRLGGSIGIVVDPVGPGAAALVGGTFAITRRVEVAIAGIAGGQQGVYAGARLYLSDARLRPAIAAGAPMFASDGFAIGLRGAAGVEWLVSGALSISAELGIEYYPDVPADRVSALFAPAIGIVARN